MNKPIENQDFAIVFANVFDSEIIYDFSLIQNPPKDIFLMDKQQIVTEFPVQFIFKGFGKKVIIQEAIDEFEFLYAILNFFENFGKVYRKLEIMDSRIEEMISISFYNPFTNVIEVCTSIRHTETSGGVHHLFWLQNLKEIIFELLNDLNKKKITTYLIKQHYSQFLTIKNNDTDEQQTNSI
jgi:hypothetical protein